nr:VENN motif pre-toxin domain-containing protein [Variovorax guangxiensis]
MDPNEVLAVSQLIGGLAGAVTGQGEQGVYIGAGAAGNAVANNRQLHPSELELAKTLYAKAQKDGLPYTLQEIEAQMR